MRYSKTVYCGFERQKEVLLCNKKLLHKNTFFLDLLHKSPFFPHYYIYKNNGSKGQYLCKVCNERFSNTNIYNRPLALSCPYCGNILVPKKDRKHFRIHKCVNSKCSYYQKNLSKLPKDLKPTDKSKRYQTLCLGHHIHVKSLFFCYKIL